MESIRGTRYKGIPSDQVKKICKEIYEEIKIGPLDLRMQKLTNRLPNFELTSSNSSGLVLNPDENKIMFLNNRKIYSLTWLVPNQEEMQKWIEQKERKDLSFAFYLPKQETIYIYEIGGVASPGGNDWYQPLLTKMGCWYRLLPAKDLFERIDHRHRRCAIQ